MRVSEIIKSQDTGARIVRLRHERSARRRADALSRLSQAVEEIKSTFGSDPATEEFVSALTHIVGQLRERHGGR